jgi:hypothetical protein
VVTGDLINSGNITAAYGIYANVVDGNLTNSGTIHDTTLGITADGGNVINSGAITVTTGDGISLGPPSGAAPTGANVNANVTNTSTGVITAGSDGVHITGNLTGGFNNAGNISGKIGVLFGSNVSGDIVTTGMITATSGAAIQLNGSVTGNLSVGGKLAAVGSLVTVGGNVGGDLINSANLTAAGEGIYVSNGFSAVESDGKTIEPTSLDPIFITGTVTAAPSRRATPAWPSSR